MFALRPYQQACEDALHKHVCEKPGVNPCVVLPTGAGKSISMASITKRWHSQAPYVRGCILAHRKELVQQNSEKLRACYDGRDRDLVGVFSAGLGEKNYDSTFTFASIDSIYKRAGEFRPFDFLFVDEAHRIPPKGEGKYRTFIKECREFNPRLMVVGFTATPFRMGCGPICHKNHILHEVCYEADVTTLIEQGYLSRLRSKVSEAKPDLEDVRRNSGGDYIVKSLAEATNKKDLVARTVKEAVAIMNREGREHAVFFCVDVLHCHAVSLELQKHGIEAPCITGKTKKETRDLIVGTFKQKRLRGVCCVNVLTEGFDAPHIDCIVLLRPTLSAGLFSQMVGRGLRIHDGKANCLVLDFAGCIEEHGPIDLLGKEDRTPLATCPECRESFSRAIGACPECGWEIPKKEIERIERAEAERRMHSDKASKKSILSTQPEILKVDVVTISRHRKVGSPDSLKVSYRCGLRMVSEWVCLEHKGYAGKIALEWWHKRGLGKEASVSGALENMLTVQAIKDFTKTITVKKKGRYPTVTGYNEEVPQGEASEQPTT
jgi:DNA repair protein RadD